ncbi:MAG: protein-methionine-sulfoxide reductase heme-binding subunit MsrQ, partial [Anaerolineae bacterium]|nr:protein-methionine-sulfoxide reductase heme-binding subunit MsrQ [Anaerolineae bacterium]
PLEVMIADYAQDRLTVNPIQELTLRTGKVALVLLVLSLACTPLNTLFGFRGALRVRRALGLYGFLYVVLHLLVFTVLDYVGDLALIVQTVLEKYYIVAGLAAFVLLVPLAVTSTRGWQRRLGQRWRALHRLVYLAVPLAVLHFALLVKSLVGRPEPLLWGALVLGLLALRIPAVRRAVARWRDRVRHTTSEWRVANRKWRMANSK